MDKMAAKKAMLRSLKEEMKSMMGEGRGDLSELMNGKKAMKVTVASDSEKGLKEGLSKAEEIMAKKSEESPMEESEYGCEECSDKGCPMCEESEEEEMESSEEEPEMEDESPEALKMKIAELKKQLASKE